MPTSTAQALVLIAPESAPCLNTTLADTILRLLPRDAVLGRRWLAQGEAWEMTFVAQADGGAWLRKQVETVLIGLPVDVNILDAAPVSRRKRLLIADMDSTIIEQECIDEIAEFAGVRDEVAAITEEAMRGELDFEEALRSRVQLLEGLSAELLERIAEERLTLTAGARVLLSTMRANGAFTALVSGGFTFFTKMIAARAGFEAQQANVLGIADGRLDGTVREPILGREAKLQALKEFAAERRLPLAETLAVGDGANDLAMIRAAGLGVAFRAKPIVAKEAKAAINHGNLKALLYLQGYSRETFVG